MPTNGGLGAWCHALKPQAGEYGEPHAYANGQEAPPLLARLMSLAS